MARKNSAAEPASDAGAGNGSAANGSGRGKRVKAEPGRGDNSAGDLERYVERLVTIKERMESEREAFNAVLVEAQERGMHKGALRAIVKRRLESDEEKAARIELEQSMDDYLARLGMLADTPLGRAAAERDMGDARLDAPPL
jgi:uncharacterized protein (UPF0335 family)